MSKIPFYVGNVVTWFVPNSVRRAHVRSAINIALYRPRIAALIQRVYGEKINSIKFVRQINLNRFVCVVNNKYFVKIFRNITREQIIEHKFLVDFVRPYLDIEIPEMHVDRRIPMYVCQKIRWRPISDFYIDTILKNEDKIKDRVADIIAQLQKIDVKSVPNYERFWFGLQPERQPEKEFADGEEPHLVLAHFDLNETNLFFDDDMNIRGVIDWDTLSIAKNPGTDMKVFLLFWNMFMERSLKNRKKL